MRWRSVTMRWRSVTMRWRSVTTRWPHWRRSRPSSAKRRPKCSSIERRRGGGRRSLEALGSGGSPDPVPPYPFLRPRASLPLPPPLPPLRCTLPCSLPQTPALTSSLLTRRLFLRCPHPLHPHPLNPHSLHPHSPRSHPLHPHSLHPHSLRPHPLHPHSLHPHPLHPHPLHPQGSRRGWQVTARTSGSEQQRKPGRQSDRWPVRRCRCWFGCEPKRLCCGGEGRAASGEAAPAAQPTFRLERGGGEGRAASGEAAPAALLERGASSAAQARGWCRRSRRRHATRRQATCESSTAHAGALTPEAGGPWAKRGGGKQQRSTSSSRAAEGAQPVGARRLGGRLGAWRVTVARAIVPLTPS